jgi:hypothetical protein
MTADLDEELDDDDDDDDLHQPHTHGQALFLVVEKASYQACVYASRGVCSSHHLVYTHTMLVPSKLVLEYEYVYIYIVCVCLHVHMLMVMMMMCLDCAYVVCMPAVLLCVCVRARAYMHMFMYDYMHASMHAVLCDWDLCRLQYSSQSMHACQCQCAHSRQCSVSIRGIQLRL